MGNHLEDFTSQSLYDGLQTLKIRVKKQSQSGLKVALFLQNHPKVKNVLYPLLTDHP